MIEDMEAGLTEGQKKLQIMTNRRWLKRKMLMKLSLHKPNLATIWKLILKKNERHDHIKRQLTFILKILTCLKIKTKYVQLIEGQYTKLYNQIF